MDNDGCGRSLPGLTLLRVTLAMGGLLWLPMTTSAQGPGVQGGQWTFLGGDAWHTRYTTADQIDASNFGNLRSLGDSMPEASAPARPGQRPLMWRAG